MKPLLILTVFMMVFTGYALIQRDSDIAVREAAVSASNSVNFTSILQSATLFQRENTSFTGVINPIDLVDYLPTGVSAINLNGDWKAAIHQGRLITYIERTNLELINNAHVLSDSVIASLTRSLGSDVQMGYVIAVSGSSARTVRFLDGVTAIDLDIPTYIPVGSFVVIGS